MCGNEVVGLIGFCFVLSVLFGSLDAFLRCCGAEVVRRGRGGLPPCGVVSPCLAVFPKNKITRFLFRFVGFSAFFSFFVQCIVWVTPRQTHAMLRLLRSNGASTESGWPGAD